MIIPVKCFTCGNVLADKYRYYQNEVRKIKMADSRRLNVNDITYLTPEFIDKTPLIVEPVPKLTPPASVALLNVIVPETVAEPANATVPLPAVKVPLLVREPPFEMVSVLGVESEAVSVFPVLITIERNVMSELTVTL